MSLEVLCSTCGKKVRTGRAGSLTQWLFTEDSCECGGKRSSLKLPETEAFGNDASSMCEFCGKLRSESRRGSLTQWVFGAERCGCDYEKLRKEMEASGELEALSSTAPEKQPEYVSDISDELIATLEAGDINYHGLSVDSFPFERYRIVSEKGRGNSGIVYEAWDCMLRKRVAIKTLYSQFWSPEELVRFQSEAKAASKLSHRNVLQVLDFGASKNGQPYMVMEFVNGSTLKDVIDKEGAIESADAVPLFLQICEGIRHAHKQGIFHRDIKSSNIMIGEDGTSGKVAKVIDFGIAAVAHGHNFESAAAGSNTIAGSPLYMSPDQLAGLPYDARSEIYSLGCVMYETLCGVVPFEAENTMATMAMHASSPVPELLNSYGELVDCPDQLEAIVRRTLAKEPGGRYRAIDDLHRELLSVRDTIAAKRQDESASAFDTDFETTEETFFKKHRVPLTVSGGLFFLVLVGFVSYKAISLLPSPGVVPSTSAVQLYDINPRDVEKRKKEKLGPFEDLVTNSLIVQYSEKHKRLTVDGQGNIDQVLERALKMKIPLRELEIENVEMSKESFSHISQFSLLGSLAVSDVTGVSTDSWLSLAQCKNLNHLRLTDLDATDDFMAALSQLKNLHQVELDRCAISPRGLGFIASLPITHLSLKTSALSSAHAGQIVRMKSLEALFVGDTGLKDADIREFAKLPRLGTLGLNGLPITDDTLVMLARKVPLVLVYIFRCQKLSPDGIAKLRLLRPYCSIVNEDSDLNNSFAPSL